MMTTGSIGPLITCLGSYSSPSNSVSEAYIFFDWRLSTVYIGDKSYIVDSQLNIYRKIASAEDLVDGQYLHKTSAFAPYWEERNYIKCLVSERNHVPPEWRGKSRKIRPTTPKTSGMIELVSRRTPLLQPHR